MKVKYKVVKKNRTSCVVSNKSKYCIKYEKGKIIESQKKTLGIFCFNTRKQAKYFMEYDLMFLEDYNIIKIKPLSKGKKPKMISCFPDRNSGIYYFYKSKRNYTFSTPDGTICYPKVLVLD
jgi:hypothetical protein